MRKNARWTYYQVPRDRTAQAVEVSIELIKEIDIAEALVVCTRYAADAGADVVGIKEVLDDDS